MRCWRVFIRRSITPYVHQELSADKAKLLEDHLLDCADCRALVSRLRTGHKIASQTPRLTVSADPWPAIEAAIDREPLPRQSNKAARRDSFAHLYGQLHRPATIISTIALVVIVVVTFILLGRRSHDREGLLAASLDLSEFRAVSVQEMERTTSSHVVAEGYVSEVGFNDEDGDLSFKLVDDLRQRDQFIVCEIIDPIKLAAPTVGSRVRVYGVSRYDRQENHNWYEVHPVLNIEVVHR
jgi:putative zinc finger protein